MHEQVLPPSDYDPTIKTIVEASPSDWVRVFRQPMGPTKVVDADIATTVRGAADKVIRVEAEPNYLLHLDFQAGHFSSRMPLSLQLRNVAMQYRHELAVVTGLVLLKPEADSPQWIGELRSMLPNHEPETTFRYRILRVWEQPPDEFLKGMGTLPLAPVCAVTNKQIPEIIREVRAKLADHPLAPDLWAATYVLLGLKYSSEFASMVLQGVLTMKESVTYQAIIAEGRAEGRAEGHATGVVEGAVDEAMKLLLRLGTIRFGPPSKANLASLKSITDLSRLEELSERILIVDSWQKLLRTSTGSSNRRSR